MKAIDTKIWRGSIIAWLFGCLVGCRHAANSSDVNLAFPYAQVIQLWGYLDCLWTVSGLSMDCQWTVSGLTDWLCDWIFPRHTCLWTASWTTVLTGFVLNMTGFALYMTGFVLHMTWFALNITAFVIKKCNIYWNPWCPDEFLDLKKFKFAFYILLHPMVTIFTLG